MSGENEVEDVVIDDRELAERWKEYQALTVNPKEEKPAVVPNPLDR
jgi:hypothetical protein